MSLLARGLIVGALCCLVYTFSVNADDPKPDAPVKAPAEATALAKQIEGAWYLSPELTRALGYKPSGIGSGTIKVDRHIDVWKFRFGHDKVTALLEKKGYRVIATGRLGDDGPSGEDCIYCVRNGETFAGLTNGEDIVFVLRIKHVAGATREKDILFLESLDDGKIEEVNALRRTAKEAGPDKPDPVAPAESDLQESTPRP